MTTAAERLVALSGPGGTTAGERWRRIGALTAGTAAAILVAYSGLPSATAAEHLAVERAAEQASRYVGGGAATHRGRKHETDDEALVRRVSEWWDLEHARQAGPERALAPKRPDQPAPVATVEAPRDDGARVLLDEGATARPQHAAERSLVALLLAQAGGLSDIRMPGPPRIHDQPQAEEVVLALALADAAGVDRVRRDSELSELERLLVSTLLAAEAPSMAG